MPATATLDELTACYPCLAGLRTGPEGHEPPALATLEAAPGTSLFDEGDSCAGFPLVLAGTISVARHSKSGRSLELYRVVPGEICVVSTAAVLRDLPLSASATSVDGVRLAVLSPALFSAWTSHAPFREFVFGVFAQRLTDLMALVDAVAFQRLDRRLADHLLGHGEVVLTTHQLLADELGTVREMVTRVLKRFETNGLVRLGRERIEVLDAVRLRDIAAGAATAL